MSVSLDILNTLLRSVGERPVTDFNSNHPTALSAKQTIEDENKTFQSRGWWFNKEYNLMLLPLPTGEVIIPSETLEIKVHNPNTRLVRRENKLYDPVKHTFNLGYTVRADVVIQLPIEDLPSTAQNYLKNQARYMFAVEEEVSAEKVKSYSQQLFLAKTLLTNEELKVLETNSQLRPVSAFLKMHMQQYGNLQYDPVYPGGGPL